MVDIPDVVNALKNDLVDRFTFRLTKPKACCGTTSVLHKIHLLLIREESYLCKFIVADGHYTFQGSVPTESLRTGN